MKNRLFNLLTCFIITVSVSAQVTSSGEPQNLSKKKNFWEGGINLYKYKFIEGPLPGENIFFNGLGFKYFSGKNVFRAGVNYSEKINKTNNYYRYDREKEIIRSGSISVGYQRLFRKARFSPYVFSDLSYGYTEEKGIYSSFGYVINYQSDSYKRRTSSFAISSGLGLRYNPFKSLVLSVEADLYYVFSMENYRYSKNDSYKYTDHVFSFDPVQVTLGFIF